jgi:putative ABC transport system permease protein
MSSHRPPRLAEWALRHMLRTPDGEHILGDLAEAYTEAREEGPGRLAAGLWYWKQVVRSVPPLLRRALAATGHPGRGYDPHRSPRPVRAAAFAPVDYLLEAKQILRGFLRRPVYPLLVVLTLGLGIGITTTTFALTYGVLLRPLPLPDGDRLVSLRHISLARPSESGVGIGPGTFVQYRDGSRLLEDPVMFHTQARYLMDDVPYTKIQMANSTPGLGELVRMPPAAGRWDTPEDADAERFVAVLSHSFWRTHYGGDPEVVGRLIHVDEQAVEIIGVAPPEAEILWEDIQMLVPIQGRIEDRSFGGFGWRGFARIREGATLEELTAELDHLLATVVEEKPRHMNGWRFWYEGERIRPAPRYLLDQQVRTARGWIWLLLGASGVVLLVGLANVATLALARSLERSTDIAVRSALGGGRRGLARLFTVEAALLAGAAALLGLAVAQVVLRALPTLAEGIIPRISSVEMDSPVALATLAAASLSAAVLVAIPSLRMPKNLGPALREATHGITRGARRTEGVLLVAQVAMAAALVIFGGLMARSFWTLRTLDLGFPSEGLHTFRLEFLLSDLRDPERNAFFRQLQERLEAIPGVTSVSAAECVPLRCALGQEIVTEVDGRRIEEDLGFLVMTSHMLPGYFATLGVDVAHGRDLEWVDAYQWGSGVVWALDEKEGWVQYTLLNQSAAEMLFPGVDPVGHSFRAGSSDWPTVVAGVVPDVVLDGLSMNPTRTGLVRYIPGGWYDGMNWLVRTELPLEAVLPGIHEAVRELAPTVPVADPTDYRGLVAEATRDRMLVLLLALLGSGLSVVLGLIGVYGALVHEVRRRRRELGIRIALGAAAADLRQAVLLRGASFLAAGLGLGLAFAACSGRALESVVYEVSPLDPGTYAAAAVLMAFLGLMAVWVPAVRASRVDALETLRVD